MRPHESDLDEEIRSHLALSVRERIERGEDPEAARVAALREFGYVPAIRDSMRRVWYSRWFDAVAALGQDMRVGLRSLLRAKGLAATVVVTLALGIGANAAIFSVVRGVLLRPLVNRGEDRLVYIRQSAPGLDSANTTFSVPEIEDFKSRVSTISAFGEFSTIEFTMIGFGEPRVVQAGVVSGSYFDVLGLRPVLGRLLAAGDDGPDAAGAAVLTHRFWSTTLNSDPAVIGRTIQLGSSSATVVGVLEPSVPYPADTEIIANVVTSPHHLGATMVTGRTHRMTELFGRLAPGATLEAARTELRAVHAAMMREHPEAYSRRANIQLSATRLRDQIAAPARTILLVLLAAAAVVFVIACSNVASLILARSVRREGELAVRAALGASPGALRRTLLAESLVLCGAGAVLGVLLAQPLVAVVSRFAARFSVRALEVTVDASLLWVGAGLAMAAAVLLAYIPRLPSSTHASSSAPAWLRWTGLARSSGSIRLTPGTNRRLRMFAITQIAFSFVLLAVAGMLLSALVAMQTADTGYNMRQVLALDVPPSSLGFISGEEMEFYQEATRRIHELPGVEGVALGSFVPWRDASRFGLGFQFAVEGHTPDGEENPHARLRVVSPGFFGVLGVPMFAGRDFTSEDRRDSELVVIVSQSLAQRLFGGATGTEREPPSPRLRSSSFVEVSPERSAGRRTRLRRPGRVDVASRGASLDGAPDALSASRNAGGPADPAKHALNRTLWWTDPYFGKPQPRRIIGVVADVDDENVVRGPALTIYHPLQQMGVAGRVFVHAAGDPYALVPPVRQIIREISANQPVERPATLEDVRAEVLAPERLNAFVVSGFAGIALLIAVVGVVGVLAFSVSARTREFGVRLAIGSTPRHLLVRVLAEGALIVAVGIVAGAAGGYAFARLTSGYLEIMQLPAALPALGAAAVLLGAAVIASLMPAARASRVDVLQALRSE
jgi:putative ABC transport system permease protein